MLAKLDSYDYMVLPGIIRIRLTATNDPDIVDIMSEINRNDGLIYLEGDRYSYLNDYNIYKYRDTAYLELHVVKTA